MIMVGLESVLFFVLFPVFGGFMYSAIRDKTSEAYAAYVKKLVIQLFSLSESNRSARFIYQEI